MSETTELHVPEAMTLESVTPAPEAPVEADKAPERQPSPRELAMERILYKRNEVLAHEVAHGEVLGNEARALAATVDPSLAEPEPIVEAAPVEDAPKPEPVAVTPAPVAPSLIDVDVPGYGRMQVTQDQLLHLARIGAVADHAMRQVPVAQPEPPPPPAPLLGDEDAKAFARRLAYGDEAEAGKALQELVANVVQRTAAPAVDATAIASRAAQMAMQQQQFVNNMHTIGMEFPDIFGKPDETNPDMLAKHHRLSRLAALELTDLRQRYAGQARSDIDLYREAASNVRATIGAPQPQPAGEQATSPALQAASSPARLERKRAAPQNPTAVSRTASLGAESSRPVTGSQIVEAMRKARGQMSMH